MPRKHEAEFHASCWGKPHGHSLLIVSETEEHGIEWMQWFLHHGKQTPILWCRKNFSEQWRKEAKGVSEVFLATVYGPTPQEFLTWVKYCENWEQKNTMATCEGSFEFLTLTQTLGGCD